MHKKREKNEYNKYTCRITLNVYNILISHRLLSFYKDLINFKMIGLVKFISTR